MSKFGQTQRAIYGQIHVALTILAYQDEVHFQQATTVTRKWALKGSAPEVKSPSGKRSLAYSGFVFPKNGQLIMTKPDWFKYDTVIASIREFLSLIELEANQMLHLVLDNAPWHKKAIRLIEDTNNTEYADIRAKVRFIRMPPYSPDLNPIEQVWRITRREVTHNRYFKTLDLLAKKLDSYFEKLSVPNPKLMDLCLFKYKS